MSEYKWIKQISEAEKGSEGKTTRGPIYVRNTPAQYKKDADNIKFTAQNLWDIFEERCNKSPDTDYLGVRVGDEFKYQSYGSVNQDIESLAYSMEKLGMRKGSRIGIYGVNSSEYMLSLWMCFRQGYVAVPLYDSLGDDALEYIVKQAEIECVLVQTLKVEKLQQVISNVAGVMTTLASKVVVWGPNSEQAASKVKASKVILFKDAISASKSTQKAKQTMDDLIMIMYTSGTTGAPKGVTINNRNLTQQVRSLALNLAEGGVIEANPYFLGKTFFSFLPLAHILDLSVELLCCYIGLRVGYSQGNPKLVLEDLKICRPHVFVCVPRVLDRAYTGFQKKLESLGVPGMIIQRVLYPIFYNIKLFNMTYFQLPKEYAFPPFDWLIGNRIQTMLGGNLLLVACGGAALSYNLEMWSRVSFNCAMFQGYGLTETSAAGALCSPKELSHAGTIGPVAPLMQLRLESIEEMGYNSCSKPPRGEILLKGDMVSKGYYKNEKQTKESFDADGWFHTGDVGEINSTGCVKIIDRKKNIFKTAVGEYIASEKLENIYGQINLVEQLWIYGNAFETQLIAIVVPDKSYIQQVAQSSGVGGSYDEQLANPKVVQAVKKAIDEAGVNAKVKGFERISAIKLTSEQFNAQNGLTTPTLKLKRPVLQKRYQKDIDQLYKNLKKGN